jgi:hypothetical protein
VARAVGGLLIAVVIAVGGFFFRDRLTGGADDLRVGDCFDLPVGVQTVEEVQHHPCTESHTAEIVGLGDHPANSNDGYPSEDALFAFADDLCARTFRNYTGRDPFDDTLLTVGYFYPIQEGWQNGDHEVACYLLRVDEGPMTSSMKIPTT